MNNTNKNMRVALIQMQSGEDISVNIDFINKKLEELSTQKVQLVSLPENALYLRIESKEIPSFDLSEEFWTDWTNWCSDTGAAIHIGSVPYKDRAESGISNATIWVDKSGPRVVYKKIHLFDVDVAGEKRVRESDHFVAGVGASTLQLGQWKIGFSICYDLRFSELFLAYAKDKVDLILVPSAFLVSTGRAHWHVLLRARAIECQSYVLAAAQGGLHRAGKIERATYGHSLAAGPWGEILSEIDGDEPGTLLVDLDFEKLAKVREQIPMEKHRRL